MLKRMSRYTKHMGKGERYTFYSNGIVAAISVAVSLYSIVQLFLSHTVNGLIESFTLLMLGLIMSYLFANNYFYYEREYSESNRLSTRREVEKAHPLDELLATAQSVDMLSASNGYLFRDETAVDYLRAALQRGVKFRMIGLDHTSVASDEFAQNKSPNMAEKQDRAVLSWIDLQLKRNPGAFKGIDYYVTEVNLPFSIMIARNQEGEAFYVKVDFYAVNLGGGSRPCLFLLKKDREQMRLFESQFEEVLLRSTPYLIGGEYNHTLRDKLLCVSGVAARSFVLEPDE